jgi:hypothetical protein
LLCQTRFHFQGKQTRDVSKGKCYHSLLYPERGFNYTASLGRNLLRNRHDIPNLIVKKWQGVLPFTFRLCWKTVWAKKRTPKEAGLLWLIWHRSVAVNMWRCRINHNISKSCVVCPRRSEESILYRFWECQSAQRA